MTKEKKKKAMRVVKDLGWVTFRAICLSVATIGSAYIGSSLALSEFAKEKIEINIRPKMDVNEVNSEG